MSADGTLMKQENFKKLMLLRLPRAAVEMIMDIIDDETEAIVKKREKDRARKVARREARKANGVSVNMAPRHGEKRDDRVYFKRGSDEFRMREAAAGKSLPTDRHGGWWFQWSPK